MNKFYKWADKKGYIKIEKNMNSSITIFMIDKNNFPCIPTKQMLIAYKMEYLIDNDINPIIPFIVTIDNIDKSLDNQIEDLNK